MFKQPLHLLAGECALCQICASVIPSEQTASSYIILYRVLVITKIVDEPHLWRRTQNQLTHSDAWCSGACSWSSLSVSTKERGVSSCKCMLKVSASWRESKLLLSASNIDDGTWTISTKFRRGAAKTLLATVPSHLVIALLRRRK